MLRKMLSVAASPSGSTTKETYPPESFHVTEPEHDRRALRDYQTLQNNSSLLNPRPQQKITSAQPDDWVMVDDSDLVDEGLQGREQRV